MYTQQVIFVREKHPVGVFRLFVRVCVLLIKPIKKNLIQGDIVVYCIDFLNILLI
jgi:hypothetical protein